MDDELLNDVAKILAVHQDETTVTNQRLEQIKHALPNVQNSLTAQTSQQEDIQSTLNQLDLTQATYTQLTQAESLIDDLKNTLTDSSPTLVSPSFEHIDSLNTTSDWSELLQQASKYGTKHQLDLTNPYYQMMSHYEFSQQTIELTNKFQLSKLEKNDYVFSTCVGIIMGLVDVLFVGRIHAGKGARGLQKAVDKQFESIVILMGRHTQKSKLIKQKAGLIKKSNGKPSQEKLKKLNELIKNVENLDKQSAIRALENAHKVSYDASTNKSIIDGSVDGMTPYNHHLRSLAHDPGIIGLVFGIVDQITGKATFIDQHGELVRKITKNVENKNVAIGPLPLQIIKAVGNWFGHLLSDISGSSSSKGRGAGLPIPFYAALQGLNFGSIPIKQKEKTIAQISEWLYRQGLDLRAFCAQSIPVLIQEVLIRTYWVCKQHLYFGTPIKNIIFSKDSADLNKLLLTSTSVFGAVDFTDATVNSGLFSIGEFLLRLNYANTLDLGFRAIQAARFKLKHLQAINKIDIDIQNEWDRILLD